MEILGKPSINRVLFFIGKFSIIGNIVFVFLKNKVEAYQFSLQVQILALLLLFISGALIFTIALINLGQSLRVGLPKEETQLKTNGMYSFSRNPIYLGVFLLCMASCIYVPHWLNIVFLILVIVIHHQIILAEEKFLYKRFGQQWITYSKTVRRYL